MSLSKQAGLGCVPMSRVASPDYLEADAMFEVDALLGRESSAGSLIVGFTFGAAAGARASGLLMPALPAFAFGTALGAYEGVLAISLCGSDAGTVRLREEHGCGR